VGVERTVPRPVLRGDSGAPRFCDPLQQLYTDLSLGATLREGSGEVSLRPTRSLVWYGYRSDEGDSTKDVGDTTAANTSFEVDLWQAGGETDVIEMGLTATARDGLHMNTIHLLSPTKRSETTIAPGLVLETWPETHSGRADSHKP
jgi:hypothetical protein